MIESAIEVQSLTKRYGDLVAVDQLSFQVRKGTVFGFLGPNGAGKTTTLKMLACLIRPDNGTALVAGHNIATEPMAVRRSIGYVSEAQGFYERMTAAETLDYLGCLLDLPGPQRRQRAADLLSQVGLADRRDSYVGTFSKGMKQRLALAQALLAEPAVLLLDEPTLGLDPMGAKEIRDRILTLKQDRTVTIFLSSHMLSEVEAICDEVGIIDHGRMLAQDSVANLRRTTDNGMEFEIVLAQPNEAVVAALQETSSVQDVKVVDGRRLMICTTGKDEVRPQIVETVVRNGGQMLSLCAKGSSLEEILLQAVGNGRER